MGFPKPNLSVIVPSLGKKAYLETLLDSLERTGSYPYPFEVCVHVYPRAALPGLKQYPFAVTVSSDDIMGMGHAGNEALARAKGEWIAWLHDDMVALDGWDDFDGRVREDRVLCWDLLEPIQGSFPPPVMAGGHPAEFDWEKANEAGKRRNRAAAEPGNFFGTFVFHRSLLAKNIRWPETPFYGTADVDLPYLLYLERPDVVFGRLGLHLYHFVHGSIRHNPHLAVPGEKAQERFVARNGVAVGEAHDRLNRRGVERWT